jgi:circadian clock protein KaiC
MDVSKSIDTQPTPADTLSTGIDGFDRILNGGLPRNRLYLIEGDPGTGKTTLGLQFLMEGVRQGEKTLYVTLSESKEEIEASARSHGWTLDGINILDLADSAGEIGADSRYTVFHPAEVELDETTRRVLTEVERTSPDRVVFDSLSEMRMLAADQLRYRRQILAIKQYFMKSSCTVLMLDDRTSESPDRQLESIAHGVVSLDYIPAEYGRQRHSLGVVKMRGLSFQSGDHDFNIETDGIKVFPRLRISSTIDTIGDSLESGDENLDALLGGLNFGTSTIFLGPAGVGKSTLSIMYVIAAAKRGERSAVYIFDEGPMTLFARTEALGLDLRKYVDEGLVMIRQIQIAELTPGEFAHMVSEEVETKAAKLVVIDSVNGYLMATPQVKFLMMQFHELLDYLNRNGIASILVVGQYGLVGSMQTPIDLSYLADTVVLMRYFEAAGAICQAISVVKKRAGKHERTIREYNISEGGIRLGQPLKDFQGVLTGVPIFKGSEGSLMKASD